MLKFISSSSGPWRSSSHLIKTLGYARWAQIYRLFSLFTISRTDIWIIEANSSTPALKCHSSTDLHCGGIHEHLQRSVMLFFAAGSIHLMRPTQNCTIPQQEIADIFHQITSLWAAVEEWTTVSCLDIDLKLCSIFQKLILWPTSKTELSGLPSEQNHISTACHFPLTAVHAGTNFTAKSTGTTP